MRKRRTQSPPRPAAPEPRREQQRSIRRHRQCSSCLYRSRSSNAQTGASKAPPERHRRKADDAERRRLLIPHGDRGNESSVYQTNARRAGVLAGAAELGADSALTAPATGPLGGADDGPNRLPIDPEKLAQHPLTQAQNRIGSFPSTRGFSARMRKCARTGRRPRQMALKRASPHRKALARAGACRRLNFPLRTANASPAAAMPRQGSVAAVGRQSPSPPTLTESRLPCTRDELVTYRGSNHGHS